MARRSKVAFRLILILGVLLVSALLIGAQSLNQYSLKGSPLMALPQEGRVRAPELEGGRGWLNTDKPLSLAALKGKIVLLDFWTYGCVNCMHIIPDLKRLEQKYANQLVVIGVHSAKFTNEKETDNIRNIILRYELEHPVINDADFKIWNAYSVNSWPTQYLIDPAGYVVGFVRGEGNYELLDGAIEKTIAEFRKRGELNEQPLSLALERAKVGDLPLAFPGKVLADEKGERLFIADSNHNRIVITKPDGTLLETIGAGTRGADDGDYARATFYRPQGLALDGDSLYVADTENHLIRRVDLRARKVLTIAGTGKQMEEYNKEGAARTVSLNSPWDLQLVGRNLYIAMAGPHQIWKLDLDKQYVQTFAGSGREARHDDELLKAGFAQPSGLATDGKTLYVSDAEANIVRAIDLTAKSPRVLTLAGGDLFEFGDVDGEGDDARLQHPLGLTFYKGKILIADTYNHKIKQLDPDSRTVKTLFGKGQPGQEDGKSSLFYEPGGLSVANGKLYVADTNNHAVRVVDLKTKETQTLMIKGLLPPPTPEVNEAAVAPNLEEIKLAPQSLLAKTAGALVVDVKLPEGYHLNPAAPQRYQVTVESGAAHVTFAGEAKNAVSRVAKALQLPLRLPLQTLDAGSGALRIQVTLFYCREDNTGSCQIKTLAWRAPVEVSADANAPREIKAQAEIK